MGIVNFLRLIKNAKKILKIVAEFLPVVELILQKLEDLPETGPEWDERIANAREYVKMIREWLDRIGLDR